ncbi:hypothetical protein ACGVWS_13995 [Enterobacteriaceae bacterium LUAb1]
MMGTLIKDKWIDSQSQIFNDNNSKTLTDEGFSKNGGTYLVVDTAGSGASLNLNASGYAVGFPNGEDPAWNTDISIVSGSMNILHSFGMILGNLGKVSLTLQRNGELNVADSVQYVKFGKNAIITLCDTSSFNLNTDITPPIESTFMLNNYAKLNLTPSFGIYPVLRCGININDNAEVNILARKDLNLTGNFSINLNAGTPALSIISSVATLQPINFRNDANIKCGINFASTGAGRFITTMTSTSSDAVDDIFKSGLLSIDNKQVTLNDKNRFDIDSTVSNLIKITKKPE